MVRLLCRIQIILHITLSFILSAESTFLSSIEVSQDRRKTPLERSTNKKDGVRYLFKEGTADISNHIFLPNREESIILDGTLDDEIWSEGEQFMELQSGESDTQHDLPIILLARKDAHLYAAIQLTTALVRNPQTDHLNLFFKNPLRAEHLHIRVYLDGRLEQGIYTDNQLKKQNTKKLKAEITQDAEYWNIELSILMNFLQISQDPGATLNFYTEYRSSTSKYRFPNASFSNMNEAPFLTLGSEVERDQYLDKLMYSRQHKLKFFYLNSVPGQAKVRKAKLRIIPIQGETLKGKFSINLTLFKNTNLILQKKFDNVHGYEYFLKTHPDQLKPGNYHWLIQSYDEDELLRSVKHNFKVLNIKDPMAQETAWKRIPLELNQIPDIDHSTWHFRTGVPFAKGAISIKTPIKLMQGQREIPFQKEVMAAWAPKGKKYGDSIRWLGIDFIDSIQKGQKHRYELLIGQHSQKDHGIKLKQNDHSITIDNGLLELTVNRAGPSRKGFNLFEKVKYRGKLVYQSQQHDGPYINDTNGNTYWSSMDETTKVEIEKQGPLAVVLKAEGWFVNPKVNTNVGLKEHLERPQGGFCRYITRIHIGYGQPDVKVQHTFILTEDSWETKYGAIGIKFFHEGQKENLFNAAIKEDLTHYSLLQYHYDQYKITSYDNDIEKVITKGKTSNGLLITDNFYVKVKNFWQNYPKEIEVNQKEQFISLHLWPKNGIDRLETKSTLNAENAFRLPFVHSGKVLDFTVPECLKDKKHYERSGFYWNNLLSSYKSNALGLSKTHELLIGFEPKDASYRAKTFEDSPHVMADARYIESTRILPFKASNSDKNPLLEHYFYNNYKWMMRAKHEYRSYGMWNYGDVNHRIEIDYKTKKFIPTYKRLWAGTHHGYMRTPWWLYLRKADHDILKQAKAQTRHIADIDICHWSNEKFGNKKTMEGILSERMNENSSGYPAHKKVGGLCDYKGYVHWHAGGRNRYNAAIDFLLFDYYLTGNLRSWDVAMEHAKYVWKERRKPADRGGAGIIDTLIDYYQATWDRQVGKDMINFTKRFIRQPYAKHYSKAYWTPWLPKYIELTQDPEAIVYSQYYLSELGFLHLGIVPSIYEMSGDPELAKFCAKQTLLAPIGNHMSDDKLDGMIGREWRTWNFSVRDLFFGQRAAESYHLKIDDFYENEWKIWYGMDVYGPTLSKLMIERDFKNFPWPNKTKLQRLTLKVHHSGENLPLRLGCIHQSGPGTQIQVFDPKGKQIFQKYLAGHWRYIRFVDEVRKISFGEVGSIKEINGKKIKANALGQYVMSKTPYKNRKSYWDFMSHTLTLNQQHQTGTYKIVYEGPQFTVVPPLSPEDKLWIGIGKNSIMGLKGIKYFYVPQDTEEFEMTFFPTYSKPRFAKKLKIAGGTIFAPDLSVAAQIDCGLKWKGNIVSIKVKPEYRGKVWFISGSSYTITEMKGLAPYISASPKAFKGQPYTPLD